MINFLEYLSDADASYICENLYYYDSNTKQILDPDAIKQMQANGDVLSEPRKNGIQVKFIDDTEKKIITKDEYERISQTKNSIEQKISNLEKELQQIEFNPQPNFTTKKVEYKTRISNLKKQLSNIPSLFKRGIDGKTIYSCSQSMLAPSNAIFDINSTNKVLTMAHVNPSELRDRIHKPDKKAGVTCVFTRKPGGPGDERVSAGNKKPEKLSTHLLHQIKKDEIEFADEKSIYKFADYVIKHQIETGKLPRQLDVVISAESSAIFNNVYLKVLKKYYKKLVIVDTTKANDTRYRHLLQPEFFGKNQQGKSVTYDPDQFRSTYGDQIVGTKKRLNVKPEEDELINTPYKLGPIPGVSYFELLPWYRAFRKWYKINPNMTGLTPPQPYDYFDNFPARKNTLQNRFHKIMRNGYLGSLSDRMGEFLASMQTDRRYLNLEITPPLKRKIKISGYTSGHTSYRMYEGSGLHLFLPKSKNAIIDCFIKRADEITSDILSRVNKQNNNWHVEQEGDFEYDTRKYDKKEVVEIGIFDESASVQPNTMRLIINELNSVLEDIESLINTRYFSDGTKHIRFNLNISYKLYPITIFQS